MQTAMFQAVFAILATTTLAATCSSNLVIDDYSKWSTNTNNLGSYTSDDGTMTSISASADQITFTPKSDDSSYFYESFDSCISATTSNYTAITFPVQAPAGGGFTLELQTSKGCGVTYNSTFFDVTGLTGQMQTVTVPLAAFDGAYLAGIQGWVWSGFTVQGTYVLGETKFVCGSGSSTSQTSSTKATSTSSATTSITASVSNNHLELRSILLRGRSNEAPAGTGACTDLLIDDWRSQSRLTFLGYNAMLQPSSDDLTMASVVVAIDNNTVTLTPTGDGSSYFYSEFGCINAKNVYGGIGLPIKAPAGTSFTVEMQSSSSCDPDANTTPVDMTTSQLGWKFDGTSKMYYLPFSKFSGLDITKLVTILFQSFGGTQAVTFGPMAFYCGSTESEYQLPAPLQPSPTPTGTVPVTSGTATPFVIDTFKKADSNDLGFWHGADNSSFTKISKNSLTVTYVDTDLAYYTQITDSCRDITAFNLEYLHIVFSGSPQFSIALQQHNPTCNDSANPYPETWDEVYAERYASGGTDIYIPLAHFAINMTRSIGIALKGFTGFAGPTVFTKIEFVKTVPSGIKIPSKVPNAPLVFACKRPNSFAFCIDDGEPALAQQVLKTVKEAGILVTFFTVGLALQDPSTNLTNVYTEMLEAGHQVAYHSYTHPPIEGLGNPVDMEWELNNDINAMKQQLNISTKYFRPPFGNEGALLREQLVDTMGPDATMVMWDVDVQDWVWAETDTPQNQLTAFQSDVNKGGSLVVMHYLYQTTVDYLPQFIAMAKATGKQLMRLDQCMEDPNAPPLP